jgi:hypothetical protein
MSGFMSMPPVVLDTRGIHQPHPVSQGFSGKGRGPGSLAHDIEQRRYTGNHLGAHTPPLSGVSKQIYANGPPPRKPRYHYDTYYNTSYPQSAAHSPAPQSGFDNMYNKAREYFWSQQQHQEPHQQQQPQQPPHTRGPSSLEIQRTKALLTLGLSLNPNTTRKEVTKAYKKAALENHPDKAKAGESHSETADKTKKFIEAKEAYEFLMYNLGNQNGGNMAKIGGNNTIKRRHKKHKLAKKTRGKKHSNRRNKTRGKTYRKTRKNTTKRR